MYISATENTDLYHKLFDDPFVYNKWLSCLKEFQQNMKTHCKGLPAAFLVTRLYVNDDLKEEFMAWLDNILQKP